MTTITKNDARNTAQDHGAGFIANVIECHHENPARKLKGLARLLLAGHAVSCGVDMDTLLIDGCVEKWSTLDRVAGREPVVIKKRGLPGFEVVA